MIDFRSELQVLVSAYDEHGGKWPQHHEDALFAAVDRARAALAEPEPEGPTDQEIQEWADASPEAPLEELDPEVHGWRRCFTSGEFGNTIRAALIHWGRPAPEPPADGEVAESVRWLRSRAGIPASPDFPAVAGQLTRAADLLERLASPACLVVNPPPEAVQALEAAGPGRIELMPADPPQPVPVSERLPKEPLAWWFTPESDEEYGWWVLEPNGMEREPQPTHWLPAHALPMPH